jgi:protein-tyrosine phosphatase
VTVDVGPCRILFVDNGNYSRSPAAEIIADHKAAERNASDRLVFSSAGVIGKHVGGPADPRTVKECARRGYDLSGFICRQANPSVFGEFDRILAMDAQNLAVFTLARREGDKAVVEPFDPDQEIPDPFYDGDGAFVRVIDMIEARIESLLSRH